MLEHMHTRCVVQICKDPEARPVGFVIDRTGKCRGAEVARCSALMSDNPEMTEDKKKAQRESLFHPLYCSLSHCNTLSPLPQFILGFCLTPSVSLSCVSTQLWATKEGRRRSWHFLICKTSLYFLPCNICGCVCAPGFPLMLNTKVRPHCLYKICRAKVSHDKRDKYVRDKCQIVESVTNKMIFQSSVQCVSFKYNFKNTACSLDLPPMGVKHFITHT